MKDGLTEALARMEPEVLALSFLPSAGEAATISAAISLKRIADRMDDIASGAATLNVDMRAL